MTRKKCTFLLLEVLIALSLMGTLITLLFSFMVQSIQVESKLEKTRQLFMERQNLQIRMQDIFTSLYSIGKTPLYTQKFPKDEFPSIVATFDNGIDPDPLFSGTVIGRIFVDEDRNLTLAYWPHELNGEKTNTWRKETLFTGVSTFSVSFLSPDESEHFLFSQKPRVFWDRSWSKSSSFPPSAMRVVIKSHQKTLEFAFRIPNSHPIPTYLDHQRSSST